jgi:hypothetical protein
VEEVLDHEYLLIRKNNDENKDIIKVQKQHCLFLFPALQIIVCTDHTTSESQGLQNGFFNSTNLLCGSL